MDTTIQSQSRPSGLVVTSWTIRRHNGLLGFASVRLASIGLTINDLAVRISAKDGKPWVSMPSKPIVRGGQPVCDDHGKQRYAPVCEWDDRATTSRFSDAVIAALEAKYGPLS